MCGIAGVHRRTKRPIPRLGELADNLLRAIATRGPDATGYLALMDDGKVQLEKAPIGAFQFTATRRLMKADARTVLLHTRFKTVGSRRDPRNAHPVASGKCAAIHNGTIYNADEIFEAFNLPRIGTVDSEVIPALIDHAGWDQLEESLSLLRGGAATAIIHTDHPDEVVLARLRSYPLVYTVTRDMVIWASTEGALRLAYQRTYGRKLAAKVIHMAEGQIIRVNGKVQLTATLPKEIIDAPDGRPERAEPVRRRRGKRARSVPLGDLYYGNGPFEPGDDCGPFGLDDCGVRWVDDLPERDDREQREALAELQAQGLSATEARQVLHDAHVWGEDLQAAVDWHRALPSYERA